MSTPFRPIEIPPGVVATATKKMRSSNWAEVNLCRWVEGQLAPIGGQAQYAYSFASRCRAVHGWYGLDGIHYIAYLCEQNVYVDTGGVLSDITPVDGMVAPVGPGIGGYSDGEYSEGLYSTERPSSLIPIDVLPNAWSLDNFGQILLAMTSPDGRLLQWDPSGGGTGDRAGGDDRSDQQQHRDRRRAARTAVRRHLADGSSRFSAWSTTAPSTRDHSGVSAGATRRTLVPGTSPTSPARRASSTSNRRARSSRRSPPEMEPFSGPRIRPT